MSICLKASLWAASSGQLLVSNVSIHFSYLCILVEQNVLCLFDQIPVPRQAVGLVIGKGGEMIKKIQTETGAKVQFKPGKFSISSTFQSNQMA